MRYYWFFFHIFQFSRFRRSLSEYRGKTWDTLLSRNVFTICHVYMTTCPCVLHHNSNQYDVFFSEILVPIARPTVSKLLRQWLHPWKTICFRRTSTPRTNRLQWTCTHALFNSILLLSTDFQGPKEYMDIFFFKLSSRWPLHNDSFYMRLLYYLKNLGKGFFFSWTKLRKKIYSLDIWIDFWILYSYEILYCSKR